MRPGPPTVLRLVVLGAVAALGLGLTAPAHAAGERHEDAVRDQVSYGGEPAPQRYADITTISTRHTRESVVVTTGYRRVGPSYFGYRERIWTPEGEYEVAYNAYVFPEAEFVLTDAFDMTVSCPGLEGRIDPDARRVRVTVPRRCLGRPDVVRIGVLTGTPRRSSPEGRLVPAPATDDAQLDGRLAGSPENTVIKLGPRVRVG